MQLLKNNVTAVFAVSDFYALEFMRFLQGKDLRIPEDSQIIGFDDKRDGAEYKTEIVLPVDLIKRESTRKL